MGSTVEHQNDLKGDFEHNDSDVLALQATLYSSELKSVFRCKECGFKTDSEELLELHREDHSLAVSEDQRLSVKTSNPQRPLILRCRRCPFKTTSKGNFKLHSFMHKKSQIFSCYLCDYKTNFENLLIMHEETHKEVKRSAASQFETKIPCPYCSYKAFNKRYLRNHVRLLHCRCESCGFKTINKIEMEMHECEKIEAHQQAQKFRDIKCPFCSFIAACRIELGYHMNSHLKHQSCENKVENNKAELDQHTNPYLDSQMSPQHKSIQESSQSLQEDSEDDVASEENSLRSRCSWSLEDKKEIYWCHLFSRHEVFRKRDAYKRQIEIMKKRGVIDSQKMAEASSSKLLSIVNYIKIRITKLKPKELKEIEKDVNNYVKNHLNELSTHSYQLLKNE